MRDRSRPAKGRMRASAAALLIGFLAGCSGIKTYPNRLDKNLLVRASTDSGSVFSTVRASLSISRLDAQCRLEYQGMVDLAKSLVPVGVPVEQWSYLVFEFSSSGVLSSSSTIAQATLLKPRAGYRYEIQVTYSDDLYNVVIHESRPGSSEWRDVALEPLDVCQPSA